MESICKFQEQRPSSSRPLTGTTDSGCPEDPLVLLSPVLTEDTRLWASADQDVTTDGGHGSPTAGIPGFIILLSSGFFKISVLI